MMKVCIVTPAVHYQPVTQDKLLRMMSLLLPFCDKVYAILGDFNAPVDQKVNVINVKIYDHRILPVKVFKYLFSQILIAVQLLKTARRIDIVIFQWGASLILPMLIAKVCRKKTVLVATGSSQDSVRLLYKNRGGYFFYLAALILAKINYGLCDRIAMIAASDRLALSLGIEKYRDKFVLFGPFYFRPNSFEMKKLTAERSCVIGYAGRLDQEKGPLQFTKSIPLISRANIDARFLIVGDGSQMTGVRDELKSSGYLEAVTLTGWVPSSELVDYLNEMKIYVLPSYTEAFGGTIEAMACGAIVVANAVGGVPDVIVDGQTGFLLTDNRPETISEKVLEVLNHPELDKIQKQAKEFVDSLFSFDKALGNSRAMLDDLAPDSVRAKT